MRAGDNAVDVQKRLRREVGEVFMDFSVFDRGDYIGVLYKFAPCTVDDDDAVFHFGNRDFVDHAFRVGVVGKMKSNEVGFFVNFVQSIDDFEIDSQIRVLIEKRIVSDDIHTKGVCRDGDFSADCAKTYNAQRFS